MLSQKNRYFIELQPDNTNPVPRYRETELRRQLANRFIEAIGEWLKDQEIEDKVHMAITALGQVQITCDADIIAQIRSREPVEIATVRQGSLLSENFNRWNGFGIPSIAI